MGKKVMIPRDIPFTVMGKDTSCPDLFNKTYKILLYVDSEGCTSCKLRLSDWKKMIFETDNLIPDQVSFLFIFKKGIDIIPLLKQNQFSYPVIIDKNGIINKLNSFPTKEIYQCFLLNNKNEVLLIGNPLSTPKIRQLYNLIITGKSNSLQPIITSIKVDTTLINYGIIKIGKSAVSSFSIKNTGSKPLLINDVTTSCGCASTEWEKQPIKPGATTKIIVKIKETEEGYFRKTIFLYCNTGLTPIKLYIKGVAQ